MGPRYEKRQLSVKTLAGPERCTTCADGYCGFKGSFSVITRGFKGVCKERTQGSMAEMRGKEQGDIELRGRRRQS